MSRFLDTHQIEVRETTPASRKLGRSDARALLRDAREVFIAKGKKLEQFPGGEAPDDVVDRMLGSTGNLRSPTLRLGKVVVVGFNEETLKKLLLR